MGRNVGLQFQVGAFVNTIGTALDILIGYNATVLDPTQQISDVHLRFNGSITGTGFINVTETVFAGTPEVIVGQVLVQNPPPILDANVDLNGTFSSVRVQKDILLGVSGPTAGSASLSFVDQFLSQTAVPEPGSVVLFGTMMLFTGVAVRSRVARKSSV